MRANKPPYKILAMVALGAGLVLANSVGWLNPIKNLTARVMAPIGGVFSGAGRDTGNFFSLIFHIKDLAAENNQLRQQNAELRYRLSQDASLREQNEALRKQFDLKDATPYKLAGADVVAYQPDSFRQFLTINRGSRDGLRDGMAVISENMLVGRLREVGDTTAKVFLVTDPDFRVNAYDQDQPGRAQGTVRGQIGGGLIMDKIAQNDIVREGDMIVTSGLGGEVPKGILIGQVESVYARDNAVFQAAQVVSGLKFSRLSTVFVIVE